MTLERVRSLITKLRSAPKSDLPDVINTLLLDLEEIQGVEKMSHKAPFTQFLQDFYQPSLLVVSTEEAQRLCSKNHLSPSGSLQLGKLHVSTEGEDLKHIKSQEPLNHMMAAAADRPLPRTCLLISPLPSPPT